MNSRNELVISFWTHLPRAIPVHSWMCIHSLCLSLSLSIHTRSLINACKWHGFMANIIVMVRCIEYRLWTTTSVPLKWRRRVVVRKMLASSIDCCQLSSSSWWASRTSECQKNIAPEHNALLHFQTYAIQIRGAVASALMMIKCARASNQLPHNFLKHFNECAIRVRESILAVHKFFITN